MPVFATSINFINKFRNETVDWLLAVEGEKIDIEIELKVETTVISSTGQPIFLNAKDGYIGNGWAVGSGGVFAEFNIGDTVYFGNYVTNVIFQTLTIVDKKSDDEVQFNTTLTDGVTPFANDYESGQAYFSLAMPITAIGYKWNFIENSESPNFTSKIDGSTMRSLIKYKEADDLTVSDMEFLGVKPYQIGSIQIEGGGISEQPSSIYYRSYYKITHSTVLTQAIIESQLDNFLNEIPPAYYLDAKCLKAIFDFEAYYDYNNPNKILTEDITEVLGNTGWYNENFNTNLTNYYIDSVVYKRPETSIIDAIELVATETTVEIVIKNTVDSPFSNNNTKFSLNFLKVPSSSLEYIGNNRTALQNFCFDTALQTVGSAAINGDNYGTDYQVLKDVLATFISASEIKITAKIAMDANVIDIISESNEFRYFLYVVTQKHTLETKLSDKVSLYVDTQPFFIDNSDPLMIVNENLFLRHPETDPLTEGTTDLSVFPEDEVVAYDKFYIDKNGRTTNDISLRSLIVRVKAKNSVNNKEFYLDSYTTNLNNLQLDNFGIQYIDLTLNRQFHIPSTEIRKSIKIKRRTDLDAANKYYYEIYFPFLVRWEYWKLLSNVDSEFFDVGEPLNGKNNFWHRFSTLTNWGLYYEVTINALKDGTPLSYNFEYQIESFDYNSNIEWFNKKIEAYTLDTNTLLYDGVNARNLILGYTDIKIRVEAEKTTTPDLSKITMNLGIYPFEQGGVEDKTRISSKWETGDDSSNFKSIDLSNKVILSLVGNKVIGEAVLKGVTLPNNLKWTAVARIYDFINECGPNGKKTEDNICKKTEDNIFKQLE